MQQFLAELLEMLVNGYAKQQQLPTSDLVRSYKNG
jgi:hypothetical protein